MLSVPTACVLGACTNRAVQRINSCEKTLEHGGSPLIIGLVTRHPLSTLNAIWPCVPLVSCLPSLEQQLQESRDLILSGQLLTVRGNVMGSGCVYSNWVTLPS